MTEKEKMIAGKVYNSQDSELVAALNKSKSLCRQYNNLDFSNVAARKVIIDELLQEEHNDGYCVFTPPFWCDYGFNVKVGKNFYSNHNLVILDCAEVTFGDNVFVGPNCGFYTAIHPIDAHQRNTGIALPNIHKRIQLLFGEEYGIYIYSQLDVGTDVEITLPIVRD